MRSLLASLVVIVGALASVAWATDGFRALTTEQARSLAVAENPIQIPDVDLLMADGSTQSLHQLVSARPGITIVGFFYSSCQSICLALASDFQQLQARIHEEGLADQVRLLSISFDPSTDSPEVLTEYQRRLGVRNESWKVAAAKDFADLPQLLNAFGIRVVDDKQGGFVHNSAFHVVSQQAELTAIVDFTRPHAVLAYAEGDQ